MCINEICFPRPNSNLGSIIVFDATRMNQVSLYGLSLLTPSLVCLIHHLYANCSNLPGKNFFDDICCLGLVNISYM